MLRAHGLKTALFRFELFEVIGIGAGILALTIFLANAARIELVFGTASPSPIVGEVVGLFAHPGACVLTAALAVLAVARSIVIRRDMRYREIAAYLLRVAIAFVFLMGMYKTVMFYINVFNPVSRDVVIQTIEKALFGGQLLSEWMQPLVNRPLTDIFSCCYMSWFVLVYATVLLMATHSRKAVSEYTFTALLTFYIGYFTYFLVPVMGPLFTVHYQQAIGGITAVFLKTEPVVSRDCFPSLHTGLSIVMMIEVWRYRRKWAWFFIPLGLLIIFSTVYLRIHYIPDLIAGLGLALTTTQTAPVFLALWDKARSVVFGREREGLTIPEVPSLEHVSYFIK